MSKSWSLSKFWLGSLALAAKGTSTSSQLPEFTQLSAWLELLVSRHSPVIGSRCCGGAGRSWSPGPWRSRQWRFCRHAWCGARFRQVDLQLSPGLVIPFSELRWRFSRSGGPGGQNVNTTDSRVELLFDLAATPSLPPQLRARALRRLEARLVEGCVVIAASEHRSQWQNRVAAQRRLVELLQEAIKPPPPPRRATKPTRGSVQRRLQAKKQRSAVKQQRRGRIQLPED